MPETFTSIFAVLSECRDVIRRHVVAAGGIKEKRSLVRSVIGDLYDRITPEMRDQIVVEWVLRNSFFLTDRKLKAGGQLNFFDGSCEGPWEIRRRDAEGKVYRTDQVLLSKFGRPEIAERRASMEENIKRAQAAADIWNHAFDQIDPILEANPGWLWEDAVNYLRSIGEPPSLPVPPGFDPDIYDEFS